MVIVNLEKKKENIEFVSDKVNLIIEKLIIQGYSETEQEYAERFRDLEERLNNLVLNYLRDEDLIYL